MGSTYSRAHKSSESLKIWSSGSIKNHSDRYVVDGKRKWWVGNVASTELNVAFSDVCRKKSKKVYETKYTFIMFWLVSCW